MIVGVVCGGLALVVGAVLTLGYVAGWFDSDDKDKGGAQATPAVSYTPGHTGGSGSGSGGYAPPQPSATPDPTASAFKRIKAGDCLTVYDTGAKSTITWSSAMPPTPVSSCDSTDALVHVSRVTSSTGSCARGPDRSYWSYRSAADRSTTVLCLTRVYHKSYCLLGKQSGTSANPRIRLGALTAVDCTAKRVPASYNQIMHITGVYKATSGTSAANCRRSQGDQTRYYAWKMNDGKTLLCTMVYQG